MKREMMTLADKIGAAPVETEEDVIALGKMSARFAAGVGSTPIQHDDAISGSGAPAQGDMTREEYSKVFREWMTQGEAQ